MKAFSRVFTLIMVVVAVGACVWLSACSGSDSKLQDYINRANEECPISFETGTLTSLASEGGAVVFNYQTDENVIPFAKLKDNTDVVKQLWKIAFLDDKSGNKGEFVSNVISSGCDVLLKYTGNDPQQKFEVKFSNVELKVLAGKNSNLAELIEIQIKLTNLTLPRQLDKATTMVETKLEDGFMVYVYDIDESQLTIAKMESEKLTYHDNILASVKREFANPASAVSAFFKQVASSGRGLRYSYRGNTSGSTLNIDIPNSELRQLAMDIPAR